MVDLRSMNGTVRRGLRFPSLVQEDSGVERDGRASNFESTANDHCAPRIRKVAGIRNTERTQNGCRKCLRNVNRRGVWVDRKRGSKVFKTPILGTLVAGDIFLEKRTVPRECRYQCTLAAKKELRMSDPDKVGHAGSEAVSRE